MSWYEAVTLLAMVLVSGFFLSYVFQWVKRVVRPAWRATVFWAVCIVAALAQEWLAGNVLGIVGDLNAGIATAGQLAGFGSATFAVATSFYNLYVGPRAAAKKAMKKHSKQLR